ncbi:MAG: resolvase domain-containing protein [Candidatus Peregrinibacteria bacterium GW2011_GWF2_33_10]|nr:MAG: resolvase domain-containing protein [Candidatus Peregrinibacteria bacterium GW2011_GWF2_33_10]
MEKPKYFLYARKSSESEDRQVQSIDDQIDRLKELAKNLNLNIIEIFKESKSAKMPENRPVFDEMLKRIEGGEAEGLMCWQINRLSRNPIDSARIQWLLQRGILKSIQTIDREYRPEDNVLIFNVESGIANQFILDLSKNVKRGMQSKRDKGWFTALPPQGYMPDLVEKTIVKDPERFDLIRKMWDLMLTGAYTPPKILAIANNEWGFKTRKTRRLGNKSLSTSGIYKLFTNIFYTGNFEWKGTVYSGKHESMITLEEYDRVQEILGRKGKPRPKTHDFPFTGVIQCGECGCMITAETKIKYIKKTNQTKSYTYYHCTKRRKDYKCSQNKSISSDELEKQIDQELESLTILPEFYDWSMEILNSNNDKEVDTKGKIYENQLNTLNTLQTQLDNLTRMRYRDFIGDEEFVSERAKLKEEITKLKGSIQNTEQRGERWFELTEKTFKFVTYARSHFNEGDINKKREIFVSLGQNFILKDARLSINLEDCLVPIKKSYKSLEEEYLGLEPEKRGMTKEQSPEINSIYSRWLGRKESNLHIRLQRPLSYH